MQKDKYFLIEILFFDLLKDKNNLLVTFSSTLQ